jgi:hypothetical protein
LLLSDARQRSGQIRVAFSKFLSLATRPGLSDSQSAEILALRPNKAPQNRTINILH